MHINEMDAVELARALAADFASRADEADRIAALPAEDVAALRDSGYLTLSIPRRYGGAGLSLVECVEAQLELAQGSASSALVAAMPLQIFGYECEVESWPEETFERLCRLVVEEGALVNSLASEPLLGSPSRGQIFQTTADRLPDGWLINGEKTWSTGGRHLTHLLVRASIGADSGVVLVPNNIEGVEWRETWRHALSLRASDSHDVVFHDVLVPPDHLIEHAAQDGPPPPNAWFPMMLGAVYLGAATAARDGAIRYALERVPTSLGQPIATLPKIQRQIGEIDVVLQAARTLFLDVAASWTGAPEHRQAQYARVAAAKQFALEAAGEVTEKALLLAGGAALTHNLPLERHFRDVRAGQMQPPSGDTAYEIVGRAAVEAMQREA